MSNLSQKTGEEESKNISRFEDKMPFSLNQADSQLNYNQTTTDGSSKFIFGSPAPNKDEALEKNKSNLNKSNMTKLFPDDSKEERMERTNLDDSDLRDLSGQDIEQYLFKHSSSEDQISLLDNARVENEKEDELLEDMNSFMLSEISFEEDPPVNKPKVSFPNPHITPQKAYPKKPSIKIKNHKYFSNLKFNRVNFKND